MRCLVSEFLFDFVGYFVTVLFARAARHTHSAERVYAASERSVGLKTDDYFVILVDISRGVGGKPRNAFGVNV